MALLPFRPELLEKLKQRAAEEHVSPDALLERWLAVEPPEHTNPIYAPNRLLQQISDAVIATDRDLHITAWNEAATRIYGWTEGEALGQPIDQLLKTEWSAKAQADAQAYLVAQGMWQGELRQRHKAGQARYVLASVSWVRSADGNIVGGVTINRDMTEHRRAEQSAREAEERYGAFIAQSFEGFVRTEFDHPIDISLPVETQIDLIYENAYMAECNQALADMYGQPREALIGTRLIDAHRGKDNPLNRATFRKLIENGYRSASDETLEYDAAGKPIWFLNNTFGLVQNGYLIRLWGTAIDITARKLADEALRESEAKFRLIADNTSDSLMTIEAPTGRILYISPAYFRQYGYTGEESQSLDARAIYNLIHPDDRDSIFQAIMSAIQVRQQNLIYEYRALHRDGHYIWREDHARFSYGPDGAHTHTHVISRDITERKLADEALRQSEERYRLLTSIISDYALSHRVNPDGTLETEWTIGTPLETRAGYTAPLASYWDITHPDDLARVRNDIQRTLQNQPTTTEYRIRTTSGDYIWISAVRQPVWDTQEGRVVRYYNVVKEITERKRAEETLRRQNQFFTVLHQITLDLLDRRSMPDLLQSIVDHAAIIMDSPLVEIMIAEGDELVVQTTTANMSFLVGERVRENTAKLSWQAFTTGQPAATDDYAHLPGRREIYDPFKLQAVVCLPIMLGHRCIGVLDLSRTAPDDPFTPEQIQQGLLFSQLIALLLDNTRLHEAAAQEITQRIQAEHAERKSTERLRSLIESQTAYVVRTDMAGDYTYVNDAFVRRFGRHGAGPEAFIGTPSLSTILPEDHQKTIEATQACILRTGTPVSVILHKPLPGGGNASTLWEFVALTGPDGTLSEIQCMGIDITELQQAREQLQLQEKALLSTANAIVITDQTGRIEWVNPAFTTLTGYTLEEARGTTVTHPEREVNDPALVNTLWNTLRAGRIWQGRLVNRRKDGSLYTEEQTITPVRDEAGNIRHFVAVKQDATEREQAERLNLEQERLKASLKKEQEFNALIQKAVSALSHDVRAPLTVISTAKGLLEQYFDRLNEVQRREKLESIGRQLHYVLQLLDDMTLVVKGSLNHRVFNPVPLNLEALCHVCIGEVQATAGTHHRLVFSTDGEVKTVTADETLISRILLNLLSNAVKFSPPQSEVRLELSQQGSWVVLRIIDYGMGIAASDIPHIFEPFYRAEAARTIGGTGLGLNIVRDCVERHQGYIDVESEPGRGTTFIVRLPTAV